MLSSKSEALAELVPRCCVAADHVSSVLPLPWRFAESISVTHWPTARLSVPFATSVVLHPLLPLPQVSALPTCSSHRAADARPVVVLSSPTGGAKSIRKTKPAGLGVPLEWMTLGLSPAVPIGQQQLEFVGVGGGAGGRPGGGGAGRGASLQISGSGLSARMQLLAS